MFKWCVSNYDKIALLEWYNMFRDAFNSKTSFANRLKYFIKPPGWKHDGTGQVSSDLRKQWEASIEDQHPGSAGPT